MIVNSKSSYLNVSKQESDAFQELQADELSAREDPDEFEADPLNEMAASKMANPSNDQSKAKDGQELPFDDVHSEGVPEVAVKKDADSDANSMERVSSEGVVGYQWKPGKALGHGTFGSVFEATSANGLVNHPVSIKTELKTAKKKELDKEA